MEKNKKKDELQSRRQFFKKAAKGTLPILGALALTQMPFLSQAHESQNEMGCSGYCSQHCSAGCSHSCQGCKGSCQTTCDGTCSNSCARGCHYTCNGLGSMRR